MNTAGAENIIIVGSGPAGLTAGIYAARAGYAPLVIEGMLSGGQLTETAEVENFPGFAEAVSGLDLMTSMRKQAEKAGVRFAMDAIVSVDFSGALHRLTGMSRTYEAKCVIIATGATPKWTNLPGEDAYKYRGIRSKELFLNQKPENRRNNKNRFLKLRTHFPKRQHFLYRLKQCFELRSYSSYTY